MYGFNALAEGCVYNLSPWQCMYIWHTDLYKCKDVINVAICGSYQATGTYLRVEHHLDLNLMCMCVCHPISSNGTSTHM